MNVEELLADLDGRIDRAAAVLANQAEEAERRGRYENAWRLTYKRDGLLIVKDWLRGYK